MKWCDAIIPLNPSVSHQSVRKTLIATSEYRANGRLQ
ncbi:hypothetical protein [Shigella phage ESh1]|nr:hypothetical protein [Shigella phage ESh1]